MSTRGRSATAAIVVITLVVIGLVGAGRRGHRHPVLAQSAKQPCVYSSDHISLLESFDVLVGRRYRCVMVFNDAAPNWPAWESPWFTTRTYTDLSWSSWVRDQPRSRELVITQNLFPASEDHADWLEQGAAGAYAAYAQALARNLVAAGLGHSIIRLGHEANGTWYPDAIPDTTTGDAEWVQFWDRTVTAMRSVPGEHFRFDWCVSSGYRDIPLADFYPGNRFVNIIGVDVYDNSATVGGGRWASIEGEPDGLMAVARFAAVHHKPISIPEWGLEPSGEPGADGAGDDPAYVDGIAAFVRRHPVAYESYFDSGNQATLLVDSPKSVSAFRGAFGSDGSSVGTTYHSGGAPTTNPPAPITITSGPAQGSTSVPGSTSFTFRSSSQLAFTCSVDGGEYGPCTSSGGESLPRLTPGFHTFEVEQLNPVGDEVALAGRTFTVATS